MTKESEVPSGTAEALFVGWLLPSLKGLNAHFGAIVPALKRWAIFGKHGSQARLRKQLGEIIQTVPLRDFEIVVPDGFEQDFRRIEGITFLVPSSLVFAGRGVGK